MSDPLTISPFEHGSYSHVVHAGLTDRLTRIWLADPAVCGRFVTVPPFTAFYAYRRVLGIAQAANDGWFAEDFELFAGNLDYEIRANTRRPQIRKIKWMRGRHEGAEYEIENAGHVTPKIGTIHNYGPHREPQAPSELERIKAMFLADAKAAVKLPTQVIEHRIYRKIPPGCHVRQGIREVIKHHDKPETDKAIQVMQFLNMTGIENEAAWIKPRLRPIKQLAA